MTWGFFDLRWTYYLLAAGLPAYIVYWRYGLLAYYAVFISVFWAIPFGAPLWGGSISDELLGVAHTFPFFYLYHFCLGEKIHEAWVAGIYHGIYFMLGVCLTVYAVKRSMSKKKEKTIDSPIDSSTPP